MLCARLARNYAPIPYTYRGSEHVRTHLDALFHFVKADGRRKNPPLEHPWAGCRYRCKTQSGNRPGLPSRPRRYPFVGKTEWQMMKRVIVLMYSVWGRYWGGPKRYLGDVSDLHSPGFSEEAPAFLIKQRSVKAVGIDTPSIDHARRGIFDPPSFRCRHRADLWERRFLAEASRQRRDSFRHSDEDQRWERGAPQDLRTATLETSGDVERSVHLSAQTWSPVLRPWGGVYFALH